MKSYEYRGFKYKGFEVVQDSLGYLLNENGDYTGIGDDWATAKRFLDEKANGNCDCSPVQVHGESIHSLTCSLFDGLPMNHRGGAPCKQ